MWKTHCPSTGAFVHCQPEWMDKWTDGTNGWFFFHVDSSLSLDSFAHWLLLGSFIDKLIDWLIDWLIDCLIDCFIDWSIVWLYGWFIDWLVGWLVVWHYSRGTNGSTTLDYWIHFSVVLRTTDDGGNIWWWGSSYMIWIKRVCWWLWCAIIRISVTIVMTMINDLIATAMLKWSWIDLHFAVFVSIHYGPARSGLLWGFGGRGMVTDIHHHPSFGCRAKVTQLLQRRVNPSKWDPTERCRGYHFWAIYNDLSRGQPKWWFSKGIPLKMASN